MLEEVIAHPSDKSSKQIRAKERFPYQSYKLNIFTEEKAYHE
jgi:hypothetical protein